ncbi:MAG: hypothetical protein EOO62_08695 [Hymenobacter sp.]|nr:MAG: hypothetical protein EOO62_08695 [Hymenobacter sp.]
MLTSSGLLAAGLVVLLLNPSLLYAHETVTSHYTIYHNQPLAPAFEQRLAQARALVGPSEVFDRGLRLEVCLHDGSPYPRLVQAVWGPAFAWAFYNKVVLNGEAQATANQLIFRDYPWNLTRLLAHELTHCYQLHHLGLWRSNPLARYPGWQWQGYAEYVARQPSSPPTLRQHLAYLQQAEQTALSQWELRLPDGTSTSREYFQYFLLTAYCLNVKHQTFAQVLRDTTSQEATYQQLLQWNAAQQAAGKR